MVEHGFRELTMFHSFSSPLQWVQAALLTLGLVANAQAEIVSDQIEAIDQVIILDGPKATLRPNAEAECTWILSIRSPVIQLVAQHLKVGFRSLDAKNLEKTGADFSGTGP